MSIPFFVAKRSKNDEEENDYESNKTQWKSG